MSGGVDGHDGKPSVTVKLALGACDLHVRLVVDPLCSGRDEGFCQASIVHADPACGGGDHGGEPPDRGLARNLGHPESSVANDSRW